MHVEIDKVQPKLEPQTNGEQLMSEQSVGKCLLEHVMRARQPARGFILNPRRRRACEYEFACEYLAWQMDQRAPELFIDESTFAASNNDRHVRVWRHLRE